MSQFQALNEMFKLLLHARQEPKPQPEEDVLPDDPESEEEMFWPDGAKTRNNELEELETL